MDEALEEAAREAGIRWDRQVKELEGTTGQTSRGDRGQAPKIGTGHRRQRQRGRLPAKGP